MDNRRIPDRMWKAVKERHVMAELDSDIARGIVATALMWIDDELANMIPKPDGNRFTLENSRDIQRRIGFEHAIREMRMKFFVAEPSPFDELLDSAEKNAPSDVERINLYSSSGTLLASRKVVR